MSSSRLISIPFLCLAVATGLAQGFVPPSIAVPPTISFSHARSKLTSYRPTTSATTTLAASPSGIDELPELVQASAFFGTYVALGLTTYPTTKLLEAMSKSIGLEKWRNNVVDTTLPLVLGLLYLSAGIGHFSNSEAFCDIYPPRGTWGLWYLPGSAEFHVAWTGVVEALGGAGLIFGGIRSIMEPEDANENLAINLVKPVCALTLFLLTIVVTPANIYMWTHGATMGPDMGQLDISFHYIRFAVQVLLLSLLITLAKDSFFFAWGDELD